MASEHEPKKGDVMKKKLMGKLSLNRETLRQLSNRENAQVAGQGTALCTTGGSNPTDGCGSIGAQCNTPACETVVNC
jgi:hypothetical protein